MPKKVNKKKKTIQKQKQKQKQTINISINSNNKKVGGKSSSQTKPQLPSYQPAPQISTIVGGTGRGSEMNKGGVSNEIADLLKAMVQQNKNFSGIGNLSRHVNETTNRQSDLESRLTDQYDFENDISDDSHTHYNNEERENLSGFKPSNLAGFRPVRNYYTNDDYSRYPTTFQSDYFRETDELPQLGYDPSFQTYPEPTESQPDTDENYKANSFEQESPNVINFSGRYVQDSINQAIKNVTPLFLPQTDTPDQPLSEDVIKQLNDLKESTQKLSEKEKQSTEELRDISKKLQKGPRWKPGEENPLRNFSFPKKEQDTLTDFSPQSNAFNQLQYPEKSLPKLVDLKYDEYIPDENMFSDSIRGRNLKKTQQTLDSIPDENMFSDSMRLKNQLNDLRNEKNAKFTTNQEMLNKLENRGINSDELINKHSELLKRFYRVGTKDELSLVKQHANSFLTSIGLKHLSNSGKEKSINFLKSAAVMNKIDELQRQLGLVVPEFPQQKEIIPLSERTMTIQDIETEKEPTKKTKTKKNKITQESTTKNDNSKSIRIEDI